MEKIQGFPDLSQPPPRGHARICKPHSGQRTSPSWCSTERRSMWRPCSISTPAGSWESRGCGLFDEPQDASLVIFFRDIAGRGGKRFDQLVRQNML